MKQKTMTIILILTIIFTMVLMAPELLNKNYNSHKQWALLGGSALLLIFIILDYKKFKLDKKDILLLIFLLLVTISTALSSNIKTSFWGMKNRFEGLFAFYSYGIIYFASKKYFKHENKKEILNILFYIGVLICLVGIMQKYVNDSKNTQEFLWKYINISRLYPFFNKGVNATFGNSNFFGSFISISLPITSYLYIVKKSKKAGILSLLLFFNMIACTTRSSWVAFIIGFVFYLVFLIVQRNKKFFLRAIAIFILFGIITSYFFGGFTYVKTKIDSIKPKKEEKTQNVQTEVDQHTEAQRKINDIQIGLRVAKETGSLNFISSNRIEIWQMCFKLIKQKPFFGCGTDNLLEGLHKCCEKDINNYIIKHHVDIDKAHNEYIHIAATNGVPAMLTYLIFLSFIVFPKMKKMFKDENIFVFTIAIICYLAQAFFNISTIGVAPLFWAILGLSDNKEFIEENN